MDNRKFVRLCLITTLVILTPILQLQPQIGLGAIPRELKIGVSSEFDNLNPIIGTSASFQLYYKLVGRGLIVLDANNEIVPQLARRVPTFENGDAQFKGKGSEKSLKVKWEIKDNAKWGDGTPVTGYDVQFSLRVGKHPNVGVLTREHYDEMDRIDVDKKNPKIFYAFYSKPKWTFNTRYTFAVLPKHIEEPIFIKYSHEIEGYARNSKYTKEPTHPGLYNGPYLISDLKLGSHMVVVPNPHFYGHAIRIPKVVVQLIPNSGTMESNLRAGNINMIGFPGLPFDQGISFEKKVNENSLPYRVNLQPSFYLEYLEINHRDPALKDIRVRKALSSAIHKDEMIKALLDGKVKKAAHFISPLDVRYTEDPKWVKVIDYSLAESRKLLEEAGWQLGEDGIRYRNGQKLHFDLAAGAGEKLRETMEVYLKEQWRQIGVSINIQNVPGRVLLGDTLKKGKYQLVLLSRNMAPNLPPRNSLHSQSIPKPENGYAGVNWGAWSRPEVDLLIEKMETEFDPVRRIQFAHQLIKFYTEDLPYIPLYYRSIVSVTPRDLLGYQLPGHWCSDTNFIENWYFKD